MKCSTCKNQLIPSTISTVSGVNGDVSVRFSNVPCLACPADHERRYSEPEFGSQLIDEIFHMGKLPLAKLKGLLRRKRVCPSCHSEMEENVTQRGTFNMNIKNFNVEMSVPTVVCRRCGSYAMPDDRELSSRLCDAIVFAFERCNLKPQ